MSSNWIAFNSAFNVCFLVSDAGFLEVIHWRASSAGGAVAAANARVLNFFTPSEVPAVQLEWRRRPLIKLLINEDPGLFQQM